MGEPMLSRQLCFMLIERFAGPHGERRIRVRRNILPYQKRL